MTGVEKWYFLQQLVAESGYRFSATAIRLDSKTRN
jgi:hypothetical protein